MCFLKTRLESNMALNYRCNICQFKSKDAKVVKAHKKIEHNIVHNVFKCTKCEKVFGAFIALNSHLRNSHLNLNKDKEVLCFLCGDISNSQKLQELHFQQMHNNVILLCDGCGYRTRNQSKLYDHYKLAHRDNAYECSQCTFMATSKDNISEHFLNIHKGVKYKCVKCSDQFSSKRELADHVKEQHEPVKVNIVTCNQCEYKTENRDNLRDHITTAHKGYILIQAKY